MKSTKWNFTDFDSIILGKLNKSGRQVLNKDIIANVTLHVKASIIHPVKKQNKENNN